MTDHPSEADELTPAEQALSDHFALLRQQPPQAPAAIVTQIVRSARWQRAIRRPLVAIGALAATVGHALRLLIKPPDPR